MNLNRNVIMTHSNPFEAIHLELNELKGLVKQILSAPKEDYSLKIYTIHEAAKIFGCNHQTVTNNIKKGNIKAFYVGSRIRIKHDQIFDSNNIVKSLKYKRQV